jgi:amino acid transporter
MLKRVNGWGVPYVAVSIMSLSICLGYLTSSSGATIVFTWLQNMIAAYNFIAWIVICAVYLRFYYAMQKQGITRDELPWKAPFQPYAAWASLICFFILLLTSGFRTFIHGR